MNQEKQKVLVKEDFLTNGKVAKKFNVTTPEATKALRALYLRHATVKVAIANTVGFRETSAVTQNRNCNHRNAFLLHPLAHDLLEQELKKQGVR